MAPWRDNPSTPLPLHPGSRRRGQVVPGELGRLLDHLGSLHGQRQQPPGEGDVGQPRPFGDSSQLPVFVVVEADEYRSTEWPAGPFTGVAPSTSRTQIAEHVGTAGTDRLYVVPFGRLVPTHPAPPTVVFPACS